MSEQKPAADRTEEPTQKRLQDARKEGQVPRSKELGAFAVVAGGLVALAGFGGWVAEQAAALMRGSLQLAAAGREPGALVPALEAAINQGLWVVTPVFLMTALAAFVGPLALGGWNLSWQAAAPKLSRVSPASGIKRLVSLHSLGELGKAVAKFLVLGGVAVLFVYYNGGRLLDLGRVPADVGIAAGVSLFLEVGLWMLGGLVAIAAIDVPLQLANHTRQLRMTRQEVRDELKETEGRPEVKSRQRQRQQEVAGAGRMIEAVPAADVVVTNPTHYAVAIKYDADAMRAPRLVASGADLVAARIRAVAEENRVPLVSAPPLARALYFTGEVDEEIPVALYKAVAQLLTYVYQLQAHRPGAPFPTLPDFDLPGPDRGGPAPQDES